MNNNSKFVISETMKRIKEILQHELIGLKCVVEKADNLHQKGLSGTVVDETMKTISIKTSKGVKKILKKGSLLKIEIEGNKVVIDGLYLVARPEDRIKKKARKW